MFTMILRAIIIYLIVLVVLRLMGKRQIGDMQPCELVITLIIADLACIPMSETTIPLLYGITPLFTLAILHYVMTVLSRKSLFLRKLINGKPVIVIDKNGINYDALKALNMTLNDLTEGLRATSCFSFTDVAFAILETNGNLSVLPKSQTLPATKEDLKIKSEENSLQIILINDGKISQENLQLLNIGEDFVKRILEKEKVKSIKDVLVMCINSYGEVFFQTKRNSAKTIPTSFRSIKIWKD